MNLRICLLSIFCYCSLLKAHEADFLLSSASSVNREWIDLWEEESTGRLSNPDNTNAPETSPPAALNDTIILSTECYFNNASVEIDVLSNDSDPNGDINPNSVLLINPLNAAQTGVAFSIANTGDWRTNGSQVTFTASAGFYGQTEISYQVCDSGGRCVTARVVVRIGTRDIRGCYPGSEWGTSRSDSIVSITGSAGVVNPGGMLGYSNYDTLDATTYGIINANTSNNAVLDFGTTISTTSFDSIRIIWASGTQGSNSGIKLEYSLNNLAYTLWGTVITNKRFPDTETTYPVPATGLRYVKISYASGATPFIDAVNAEKWSCSPLVLSAENDDISIYEDNPTQINVLKNDIFSGKESAGISIVASPRIGSVSLNPDNSITYLNNTDIPTGTGANAANGLDTFSYKICDRLGFCDTAQVFVTIINDKCNSGEYKPIQLINKTLTVLGNNTNMIDTYIDKDKQDINYGTGTSFDLGLTVKEYRALIKYNVKLLRDSIPSNAVIDSALFSIYRTGGAAVNLIYSIHRLTRLWTETGATWNRTNGTILWTTPGGDFSSNRITSILSSPVNNYRSFEIKRLVQSWITAGSTDTFGFLIRQSTNPLINSLHTFQSSEGTSTRVPKLAVYYSINNASCAQIVNRPPMSNPDYAAIGTEDSVIITPLINDTDPDNNSVVIANVRGLSPQNGTAAIVGNNLIYKPNFSITAPRTDTLLYRVSDGLLFDSAYIFIKIAFGVNAGTDRIICSSKDTLRLSGKITGNSASCQWKSNGTGQFSNSTSTTPVYTLSNSDRNLTTLSIYLDATSASGCRAISDTINFNIGKQPVVTAGGPDSVCAAASPAAITLTGSSLTNASNGTWSIISGTGSLSSTAAQPNPATVSFTPGSGFSGNVQLKLKSNSTASCPADSANRNIFIKPNLQILTNPASRSICQGDNDTLIVTTNVGSSSFQWFSSSNGTTWTSMSDSGGYSGTSSASLICSALPLTSSNLQFKVRISNPVACQSPAECTPVSLKFKNLWLGNSNSNWENTLNWSDQNLPGSECPEVYIMGNRPNSPVISNTASLSNIRIMDNGLLTVNGRLRLSGNINTEGSGRINANSGTIELFGNSVAQVISGSDFIQRKIRNLVISNAAGVNISNAAGDTLNLSGKLSFGNVNNSILNSGNNLTLVSDSNGTAAVADITNDGANSGNSITGNVTVERYISQARKWQFLSVPTNTTQTFRQSWMEGANSISENPRPGYGTVITDNRPDWLARGFDAQSPGGPSVKLYNPSTGNYDAIPNTSSGISTDFGYMSFIRGDRTATPSNSVRNRTTLRTSGPLKQGEQAPIPIPDSSFVAIGNPYASTIDMGKIYKPNCENYIWIWDPGLTSGYGVGAYQTFFGFEFQGYYYYYPTPGGGSYPFNDAFNQIQSGQAFFVRGGDSSASYVQMRESAKMSDSNRLVMRPGQLPFGILRSNLFSLVNNSPELADGISVFLAAGLNNEAGPDDAVKMRNNGINVSLNNNGKQFAVEGKGSLRERDTFFLNITGLGHGNFEWNVEMQNMNLPGRSAWLVDKFTKSRTRLSLEGNTYYRFSTNTNPASSATDRFMIVFRQPPVKPLEFTRFSGNRTDDRIALSWNVQNENSDWKYEIERSENKNEFILLDENSQQASGKGISEYFFSDNDPLPGINHYRIKAKDALGNVVYSKKISVGENPTGDFVSIRPNPVKDKKIKLFLSAPEAGQYLIELLDNSGAVVSSGRYYLLTGNSELRIPLQESTPAGAYFLKISGDNDKRRSVQKIIIE